MEKITFNLKGLVVVVDYSKSKIYVDQIEFMDASMNSCDLKKDSFAMRIL
jgi:hypothetical protein